MIYYMCTGKEAAMQFKFESQVSYKWIEFFLSAGGELPTVDELKEFFKDMPVEDRPELVWARSILKRVCVYAPKSDKFEFPLDSTTSASLYQPV